MVLMVVLSGSAIKEKLAGICKLLLLYGRKKTTCKEKLILLKRQQLHTAHSNHKHHHHHQNNNNKINEMQRTFLTKNSSIIQFHIRIYLARIRIILLYFKKSSTNQDVEKAVAYYEEPLPGTINFKSKTNYGNQQHIREN